MGYDFFAGYSPRGGLGRALGVAAVCLGCIWGLCVPVVAASASLPTVAASAVLPGSFSSPAPRQSGQAQSGQAQSEDAILEREALEAVRRAERSLSLQRDIPDGSGAMRRENDAVDIKPPSVRFSEDVARIILYAGVAAIIVVVLATLKDNLWSRSRSRRLTRREETAAPSETALRMEKARVEAEEFASAGSYAEAMHVLLLQSVNELRKRLDISIAASLTSREILHRVSLPDAGKKAFGEVIGWVEISYFGFHEPTREEYVSCRMSYEILAAQLRSGSGALPQGPDEPGRAPSVTPGNAAGPGRDSGGQA